MSEQGASLIRPQSPCLTHSQSAQAKRAHPDPDQSPDGKAEDEQAASNLALAPFDEDE
jgi:hypothetical protein